MIYQLPIFGREKNTWSNGKVESGKSPDNNRAADDRLSRKSRKKKKKKKQREGFPVGFLGPRGGEEGGVFVFFGG